MAKGTKKAESNANLGFEANLSLSADKLRNYMDAAEYKHVVLGLIFLKYISDTFDEHHGPGLSGDFTLLSRRVRETRIANLVQSL